MSKKKVILGLSGGVDSSVSLYLLLKEGYDVTPVFMRNWDSALNDDVKGQIRSFDDVCEQEQDYMDALAVCNHFGVKLERVDFINDYWNEVFSYFLNEYKKNRTPNPDILCNNEIKFKAFIKYASKFNYDYIAMGHYANVIHDENGSKLIRAKDHNKDQTYFLSQLKESQLKNVLFPIGHLTKEEVRDIAVKQNIPTAEKKDSTGICFIGERHFNDFLSNYLPAQEGLMKRLDGTIIKKHFGLMNYTIGQRRGLGIGGSSNSTNAWYVVGKDLKTNTLYVEPDSEHPYLYSNKAIITDVVFRGKKISGKMTAKFRYRQKDQDVFVKWINDNTIEVTYNHKVKAVTPGQACVLYKEDVCLGSGFIDKVYMDDIERIYS